MIADFISPEILGIFLIAVMLFSIFVGFPISFTLIEVETVMKKP